MLILKQNSANSVPTPPAGKGTIFLDDSDTLSVKTSDGNVETFPTVAASNTQVVFIDGTSLTGNANLTYNKNTDTFAVVTVSAANVKTDNLLYANGSPWDLSDPGGSNTQVQFNDDESFGGSSAFTFNKTSNAVTMSGNLTAANVSGGNLVSANYLYGTLTVNAQPNITSVGTLTTLSVTGALGGGDFTASGNAVITGNLTVNGNITYINVDTLSVEDPIISLGGGPNGAPLTNNDGKDRGTLLHYYTTSAIDAFMGWDNSNGEFGFGSNVSIVNDVITFNTLGNLRASTLLANVNGATALFSGNANANNFNAAGAFYGNAAGLTNIPGGNITGNITGNISNAAHAVTANTVVDAAQPNITSVGTLTSLSVTGNVSAGGLLTNNLYYANGSPWDLQLPGGSNTQIQFNDGNEFGGSAAFSFNKTSNLVTLTGGLYVNANNAVRIGPTSNLISYPNVQFVSSYGTSGVTSPVGAGVVGEAVGVSSTPGLDVVGVAGVAVVNGAGRASGVIGTAYVTDTTDTGAAVGVRGVSILSHTGGYNIGLLGNAANGGLGSYAFYIQQGGIGSIEGNAYWDLYDDSVAALAFNSTGKANILLISSDDGNEGVSMSGTLSVTGNSNVSNLGASGLITATGNVSGGNITTAGVVTATGNVSGGNITTAGAVAATGNVSGGNLTTTGALSVTGNANVGNIGTAALVVTGNVTGNLLPSANVTYDLGSDTQRWRDLYLSGNTIKLGTQNISSNTTSVVFSGTLTGNGAGLQQLNASNIASGTLDAARLTGNYTINVLGWANTVADNAQPNITSVGTLTSLAVTGNGTFGNVYANSGTIGAQTLKGEGGNISNISGANITGQVANALVAGTVYTAAQPNITSVGTLTGLGVNGNITAANITANTGVFTGNGSGLSQLAGANVTGQVANALVAGTVYTNAQPNITSVGTLTSLAVTGNVTAGNVTGANLVSANFLTGTLTTAAQPNVTSVGVLTGLGVNGNITAANITANTGVFTGNGSGLSALAGANVTGQVGNALVAGTVYTNAQPNITSVGTLTSLGVSGNITAANITANTGVFTGNGSGLSALAGANVTGQVGNALVAGTVYTNSQPNITSVGTLTSLSVTGTASAGNLSTGGNLTVSGTGSFGGNVAMGNFWVTGLNEPVNATDAATKKYVDDVAQGLNVHDSCAAATPDTLANVTSGTITYNNGANGVGAFLSTTGTFNLIDGVNVQTSGTRILVKNEANAVHNGIYTYTNTTAITRAADFNSIPEVEAGDFTFITGGTLYDNTGWVQTESPTGIGTAGNNISFTQFSGAGTYNAGTGLTLTGPTFSVNASQTQVTALGTVTTGTWNSLVGSSATFAAGLSGANLASITGANVTGTVPAATVAGTVTTAAQPNITSVGTLTSLGVNGTVTAVAFTANTGVFTGNGSGLSAIAGANVTGTVGSATTAGTVTTAAQPNITSVGTLTGLGVNGTITGVNITANTGVFTGNANGLTNIPAGNISGQVANALVAGTVYTAAQPNITSVGTLSSLAVTGNASAGNLNTAGAVVASTLTSNVATGTAPLTVTSTTRVANLNVAYANVADSINVTTQSSGNAFLIFANALTGNVAETANAAFVANTSNGALYATTFIGTLSGAATTAGTVTTAAQPNITSVGTLTSLGVNGTVTAVAFTANTGVFTGNGSGLSAIAGANVTGAVSSATTAGTVTTAAQPNITSVGTLSSLAVTGNATAGNVYANSGTIGASLLTGTLTTAAQPNITSVGTLTSLTVSGNLVCSAFFDASVNAAVSAAGTAQGNATVIASEINVVSTVASGAGVALPTAVAGVRVTLINTAANALLVYPASGGAINSLATNAAYSLPAGGRLEYVAVSTTQWYTLNATYG